MRGIEGQGPYADIIDAYSPSGPEATVRLGLRSENLQRDVGLRLYTLISQYYGIVQNGLMLATHAFRGVKRPLMHGENMEADKQVIVYSWCAEADYVWVGSAFKGGPEKRSPPPGRVFVVLVRQEQENPHRVFGSIERWNWLKEDQNLPCAPVDWHKRYGEKLWSRIP